MPVPAKCVEQLPKKRLQLRNAANLATFQIPKQIRENNFPYILFTTYFNRFKQCRGSDPGKSSGSMQIRIQTKLS